MLLHVVAIEAPDRERPFPLELAVAMPKGDRGDFLVEKLTELGATRFTPLETVRTIVVPKETRIDNLRQAVIEASKQCGRNVLMRVDAVARWPAFLARTDLPPNRFILAPGAVRALGATDGGVVIAVGPEGGWEREEVEAATRAGWIEVGLGPRTLRTETAALAAAACVGLTQ